MSTYRERRLAKADRLDGWAEANAARSTAELDQARRMADVIPFGEPIHVGHHSEGRDRNYRKRIGRTYDRGFEDAAKAADQASRAAGIRRAADRAIYSDDPDAIEQLTARIAELEAERDACKAANAAYRKEHKAELAGLTAYGRDQVLPFASWHVTNLTGNIGRQRKRLEQLTREAARPAGQVARTVPNRRPGPCRVCAQTVEVGAGWAEKIDGRWSVRHQTCEAPDPKETP